MRKDILSLLLLLMIFITGCNAQQPSDNNKTNGTIVVLETNQGNIELKMMPKVAPLAVENFTTHVKNGYYNGLIFHRVIKNFMIQGGDPTGTGRGGESIWHKEFINEYGKNVVFDRPFLLAMANHGPNTNGSQFFITTVPTPHLNGGYTIFGEVVSGQEVVKKIENTKTARADRPVVEQKIIKAYIK
jgi:peptidylprolyl isomerase